MKIKFLNSLISNNRQRCGVGLVVFVGLALFSLTSGVAQLKTPRRVTALQLGQAAEGSRVTLVSDSALNDYEAFRRGDRFYVRIPLADLAAAAPRFRADGFEDVSIQKSGDGVVVSFKLQPGATARVDQRGNRLDVIFSAPNRNSANSSARLGSGPTAGRVETPQTGSDRGRDAAGPLPPGSVPASRGGRAVERVGSGTESGAPQNPQVLTNPPVGVNRNSRKTSPTPSPAGSSAVISASPVSSPSSILSSGNANYPALSSATPSFSPASRPGANTAGSRGASSWRQRGAAAFQWASSNRLATLLGALILLSLILYLALAFRNRQKTVDKAGRAKTPKVQPKYSPGAELNELSSAPAKEPKAEVKAPRSGAVSAPSTTDVNEPGTVPATPAATTPSHQWVLTKPTIASPTAGPDEYSSEEEEREVFEL